MTYMKKHPVLRNILIDLMCTGLVLIVFALFHHVLPRQQQGLGIVISNPNRTETEEDTSGFTLPEGGQLTASAGISDIPSAMSAKGGKGGKGSGSGGKGGGTNSKGGSALTDDGSAAAEETDDTPISGKFADRYTESVEVTENSYTSPDISITVSEETLGRTTYYLADIYVRDITCFRSAMAGDTYGSGFRDSIADMAALNNALLADKLRRMRAVLRRDDAGDAGRFLFRGGRGGTGSLAGMDLRTRPAGYRRQRTDVLRQHRAHHLGQSPHRHRLLRTGSLLPGGGGRARRIGGNYPAGPEPAVL